jgi:hypothetical protein
MSAQEAIDHLGTIAKSGTKDFMGKLSGDQKAGRAADRPVRRGLLLRLHRGRQDHRRVAPRRPEGQTEGVRWVSGGTGDFEVETITRAARGTSVILHLREDAEEYPTPGSSRGHRQILRPHQPAHPDGKGRVEGRRADRGRRIRRPPARRHGQDRRVGNRQQGQRPVDAPQEGHHATSSTPSSTRPSATTSRRRWPGRTTASKAAPNTRSCSTSRPRRRSTCGTATRRPASSCTSSASSSWTTPRRCCPPTCASSRA